MRFNRPPFGFGGGAVRVRMLRNRANPRALRLNTVCAKPGGNGSPAAD